MNTSKKSKSTDKRIDKGTAEKKTSVKKSVRSKKKSVGNKSVAVKKSPDQKKNQAETKASSKNEPSIATSISETNISSQEISNSDNQLSDPVYVLDSVMVINNARDVHIELSKLSDLSVSVTIDASQVEMIDTAIFQLLVAFVIKIRSSNLKVLWKSPSTEFLERASMLNLSNALCLNVAET